MIDHVVILAPRALGETIAEQVHGLAPEVRCSIAETEAELSAASRTPSRRPLLLSHGTSVIVPEEVLARFDRRAVNVHAASADYPGRDPHHFAVYDGAARYGATAHRMAPSVDSGEIIAVREFEVEPPVTPRQLLERANGCAGELIRDLLPDLLADRLHEVPGATWGKRKTTRRDFVQLCRVPPHVDEEELRRRKAATDWEGRNNLHIDLHGLRFRLEGPVPDQERRDIAARWSEFTEEGYARLLDLALARYRFATFDSPGDDTHVLWRHDIDFSVHRAAKLASLEADRGVVATYFLMLRSEFYSLTDPAILACIRKIKSLGHRFGLHLQADPGRPGETRLAEIEERVARESEVLSSVIAAPLDAVSFHNPDVGGLINIEAERLGPLVSTYGATFRDRYGYCSDSNGYWRHRALGEVLTDGTHPRLQVLTHPGWWTPEPMSPHARIERCLIGRANAVMRNYEQDLRQFCRQNLK